MRATEDVDHGTSFSPSNGRRDDAWATVPKDAHIPRTSAPRSEDRDSVFVIESSKESWTWKK